MLLCIKTTRCARQLNLIRKVISSIVFLNVTGTALGACPAGTQAVAAWGCVKNEEVEQAKRNCQKVADTVHKSVPFTECLCQDGKDVGACGD